MEEALQCVVCGTLIPKSEVLTEACENTHHFCSQICLEHSRIFDEKYCPFCKKYFFSEDDWSGECLYCGRFWWLEERCLEDYSDCWLETEWDD